MKKLLYTLLLFLSIFCYGQENEYKKALALYNDKNYTETITVSEKILIGNPNPIIKVYVSYMIADSYKSLENYPQAYIKFKAYLDILNNSNSFSKKDLEKAKANIETIIAELETLISNIENRQIKDTIKIASNPNSSEPKIKTVETTNTADTVKEDKIATLTASGTGKTIEEARLNAMRSAIEQAFGAFISSKTEILNDNLVKDEIVSVANGNIQKYEVISQIELPNIGYGITINATVSIDKLTSFAESKGVVVEFKGGMFGATIKLQKLNEEAEINTIYSMIGMLHENMQLSFDYNINALEPKSKDAENKFWEIPISIDVIPNSNMKNCAEYLINTLKGISLNQVEVENYKTLNKSVFPVEISFNGQKTIINLRKQISNSILLSFARNFDFYTKSFEIQTMFPDINNKIYDKELNAEPFYYSKNYDENILEKISFPSINKRYTNYNYTDLRSLSELEKIDKYTIIPIVKSKFKEGGYVIFETSDGHGLVCSLTSMVGEFNFYEGETIAKEANFANYKDWYIPNKEEFKLLNKELDSKRLIEVSYFWTSSCWNQITSTEHFENITNCKLLPFAWRAKNASAGNRLSDDMYCPKDKYKNTVRLVRKF